MRGEVPLDNKIINQLIKIGQTTSCINLSCIYCTCQTSILEMVKRFYQSTDHSNSMVIETTPQYIEDESDLFM
jgi:G3E family GTPase